MQRFSGRIFKIGINPCLVPPNAVMEQLFTDAGKRSGAIPVMGKLEDAPFTQTLVKFSGKWRLYINGQMLTDSGLKNGDMGHVQIEFDPRSRTVPLGQQLKEALAKDKTAKKAYDSLPPSRQKEINRYLTGLKTEATLQRNIVVVVDSLAGRGTTGLHALLRIPRDNPQE